MQLRDDPFPRLLQDGDTRAEGDADIRPAVLSEDESRSDEDARLPEDAVTEHLARGTLPVARSRHPSPQEQAGGMGVVTDAERVEDPAGFDPAPGILRLRSSNHSGPWDSASTAASCNGLNMPESIWLFTFNTSATSSFAPATMPMRQPDMLCALLSELSSNTQPEAPCAARIDPGSGLRMKE